jgi:O-antigen ligase
MTAVTVAADADVRLVAAGRVQALALAAVCWGALAFGAAYPWAFWPLAGLALASGALGCATAAEPERRGLPAALALCGAAMAIQLIPLPLSWLGALSPNVLAILEKTDFSYGAGLTRVHPLSIDPGATLVAVALFGSFAAFAIGLARTMAVRSPRMLAEGLTVFGVLLALVGIIQKPLYAGRLLGVWASETAGSPFGPFVNKNHFAGWMLMALPLSVGLLCSGLERAMRETKPGWRHKVLWLSSPQANRLVLLAAGALIMALSLVLTMSRSGITALVLSLLLLGVMVVRGLGGRPRRAIGAAYLVVLLGATMAWVGVDVLAARFGNTNWHEFNDRRGAWIDALGVLASFPLAGTGLHTYATAARFYQRHDLASFYGEAHNDYLQLLAEGGLLVAIPALLCLAALGAEVRRRMKSDSPGSSWWLRRAAVTALVAIGFQETVEFSLQMPGNAALFAMVCAFAIHPPRDIRPRAESVERPRLRVVASKALAGSR